MGMISLLVIIPCVLVGSVIGAWLGHKLADRLYGK